MYTSAGFLLVLSSGKKCSEEVILYFNRGLEEIPNTPLHIYIYYPFNLSINSSLYAGILPGIFFSFQGPIFVNFTLEFFFFNFCEKAFYFGEKYFYFYIYIL